MRKNIATPTSLVQSVGSFVRGPLLAAALAAIVAAPAPAVARCITKPIDKATPLFKVPPHRTGLEAVSVDSPQQLNYLVKMVDKMSPK